MGTRWCLKCQDLVQSVRKPVCEVCGLPISESGLCRRCQENRPRFRKLRSWAVFEQPVRNALHRLKYHRDIGLGEALSVAMVGFVQGLSWPVDMVIPVPLGKKRKKERGYNQVAVIALPLAVQLELAYAPEALHRVRETRSQVGLSAAERQENVHNAFNAHSSSVKGHTILLVDDVLTTGSTLSAAADALLSSGAKDVYAVTVARALSHHSLDYV